MLALAPLALLLAAPLPGAQTILRSHYGVDQNDGFGHAVAVVGDVDGDGVRDYAASAPDGYIADGDVGRVQVFSGATGRLLYTFLGDESGQQFGHAIAGGGDVDRDGFPDLLVGAVSADPGDVGLLRVLSGRTGAVVLDIVGPPATFLGRSVAPAGDLDGDGHADVAGVAGHADGGELRVHAGRDGSLMRELTGPSCTFGFGVAMDGGEDVNGDGYAELVVGSTYSYCAGTESGSVLVFSGSDGTVLWTRNGAAPEEHFGDAVAFVGDLDGDGRSEIAVGAPDAADAAGVVERAGRVDVLSGVDGALRFSVYGSAAVDLLGYAVGRAGDVDGDGVPDVAVGVPYADGGGTVSGEVQVRSGVDGTLLVRLAGGPSELVGWSVAGLDDLTGDGLPELLVGAKSDDTAASSAGAVHVVDLFVDCNGNGIHDGAERVSGADFDCNGNLVLDSCDLAAGTSADCNGNGVPDECDLGGGASADCDGNGLPDECDVAAGRATDCDADGVLDECETPAYDYERESGDLQLYPWLTPTLTLLSAPVAQSDVTVEVTVMGGVGGPTRYLDLRLNGYLLGPLFDSHSSSCTETSETVVIERATFEALVDGQSAAFRLEPSDGVGGCVNPFARIRVSYAWAGPVDCNANGLPDECEIAAGSSTDANANGVLDECELSSYCVAAPNSSGAPAQLVWSGSSSVTRDDLRLVALSLPPLVNGLFVYAAAGGYTPLGDGFLCLDPSQGFVNRLPFESATAAGVLTHDLDLGHPPSTVTRIRAGQTWHFQCWFRDPAAGGAGFNFSNGLRVLFTP